MATIQVSPEMVPFYVGDDYEVDHKIANLPAGSTIVSATFAIKVNETDLQAQAKIVKTVTATPSANGQITSAGVLQPDGTVTAEAIFLLSGGAVGDTGPATLSPATTYWWYDHVVTNTGANYTSDHSTVTTQAGGPMG